MALASVICFCLVLTAHGTNYYISQSGSNSNSGTSPTQPWASVAQLYKVTLQPYDAVFFEGTVPNVGITASVTGLHFGSFGKIPPNLVTTEDTKSGIWVNADDIVVTNLTFTGPASPSYEEHLHNLQLRDELVHGAQDLGLDGDVFADAPTGSMRGLTKHHHKQAVTGSGVLLWTASKRPKNILISNVTVQGFKIGVSVGAYSGKSGGNSAKGLPQYNTGFDNVMIQKVTAIHNIYVGIETYGYYAGKQQTRQSHNDITITECLAHSNKGDRNYVENHSGSGIIISGTNFGTITKSVAYSNGEENGSHGGGPVGIWAWQTVNTVISHCVAFNNSNGFGPADGGGFDLDGGTVNGTIEYCLSFYNAGPGVLLCEFNGCAQNSLNLAQFTVSYLDGLRATDSSAITMYTPHSTKLPNSIVRGNTFIVAPAKTRHLHSVVQLDGGGSFQGTMMHDNAFLVLSNDKGGVPVINAQDNFSSQVTFANNEYWSEGSSERFVWGSNTYNSLAAFRNGTGEESHNGHDTGSAKNPQLSYNSTFFHNCVEWHYWYPTIPNSPFLDSVRKFGGC